MDRKLTVKAKRLAARKQRVRKKIFGTGSRPRVCVKFTNRNVIAQIVNDENGTTLAYVTTVGSSDISGKNMKVATKIGAKLAEKALDLGLKELVFDRGSKRYIGKVKEVATAIREKGLIL